MTIVKIAEDAIQLFLEDLERRDASVPNDEDTEFAKAVALTEVAEGTVEEQAKLDAFPVMLAALEAITAHDKNGRLFDAAILQCLAAIGKGKAAEATL